MTKSEKEREKDSYFSAALVPIGSAFPWKFDEEGDIKVGTVNHDKNCDEDCSFNSFKGRDPKKRALSVSLFY